MEPAASAFPFFFLLTFAMVGVFMATLVMIWIAVWRASRRGDAASKPPEPRPPRAEPSLPSRRRLLWLAAIGVGGGVLIGVAASALAARGGQPGMGHVG
jgi:hypothetical protein